MIPYTHAVIRRNVAEGITPKLTARKGLREGLVNLQLHLYIFALLLCMSHAQVIWFRPG